MKSVFYYLIAFLSIPLVMAPAETDSHLLEPANLDLESMQMFNCGQSRTDLGFRLAGIETRAMAPDGKT